MELPPFVVPLGLSLVLGLLVGLQRQWAADEVAGIRTFALVTLLGGLSGLLLEELGPWVAAAGFLALASLLVLGNVVRLLSPETTDPTPGMTTEVAALVMFLVGVAVGLGYTMPAVVVGGVVAVLLQWKARLHGLVERLGERDVQAIFRLVLIALVILPALPNRDIGPYEVINPFEIWLLVVLIVGISTGAYVAYKLLGTRGGTLVAGLMGGLISSTATAVSTARRTRERQIPVPDGTLVILISSSVVVVRVLIEIAIVAPQFLSVAGPPLGVLLVLMAGTCVAARVLGRGSSSMQLDEQGPPSDLAGAITFGLLYAVVLVAVAAANEHLGRAGVYTAAALSGLTDMDAITLSTSRLVSAGGIAPDIGWRMILIGSVANLAFKAGTVAALGGRRLARQVGTAFGAAIAGSLLLLWLWP